MSKKTKALPSLLSFDRSLNATDGLLWGGDASGTVWRPVEVEVRSAKGVIGPKNAVLDPPTEKDVAAGEKGSAKNAHVPNLQRGDDARLPHDMIRLRLTYGLVFGSHALAPCAVEGRSPFLEAFRGFMAGFVADGGFSELAWRYVYRVLEGGSAWRNLQVMASASIRVEGMDGSVLYAGPLLPRCARLSETERAMVASGASAFADGVAAALSGTGPSFFVRISIEGESFPGAPVWPSQLLGKRKDEAGEISRWLMSVKANKVERHAAISSQKIANPIRRIDGWHGLLGVPDLPAEVYGQNLSEMRAFRTERSVSKDNATFFAILEEIGQGAAVSRPHQLYAVAVLVRGGVFSES